MSDPITAAINGNWAALGGWGLAIFETGTLLSLVLTGRLRTAGEFRKMEATVDGLRSALSKALDQNTLLIQANEIVKHFFQTWLPASRDREDVTTTGGQHES